MKCKQNNPTDTLNLWRYSKFAHKSMGLSKSF